MDNALREVIVIINVFGAALLIIVVTALIWLSHSMRKLENRQAEHEHALSSKLGDHYLNVARVHSAAELTLASQNKKLDALAAHAGLVFTHVPAESEKYLLVQAPGGRAEVDKLHAATETCLHAIHMSDTAEYGPRGGRG